jgi:hypothetical protein
MSVNPKLPGSDRACLDIAAAAETVGHAKDEMVGPDVGFERSAAVQIGIVAGEADLIIPGPPRSGQRCHYPSSRTTADPELG